MNPTITAALANQRHAELVADAERRHAARVVRMATRALPGTDPAGGGSKHGASRSLPVRIARAAGRPAVALRCWVAAGLL